MSEQQTTKETPIQADEAVDSSSEQIKSKKKERTPKQLENIKKAQAKRTENLREMKKLKEQHDKEKESARLLKQQERDEEIARKAIE
ncbi:hypothetical protein DFS34DRAFT_651273 [Phlyctochytrium arcticum]|nr:hypothetical protein DFS34DRAFT_651273 [Phlyctochytrium arcticum]